MAVSGAAGNISSHLLFMVSHRLTDSLTCTLSVQESILPALHGLLSWASLTAVQLASGGVFGMDQPINFQLLGSEESQRKLEGVAMELEDSLYPLLREVIHAASLYTSRYH